MMRRLVISCFFVTGCATTSDEVSLKKMALKDRIYVGRVAVKFNDDESPKCEIYLNFDIAPSIRLASDGLMVYKTDREKLLLRSIACYHAADNSKAAWHHQKLNLTPIARGTDRNEVKYFGDIAINWKFDPNSTREAAAQDHESLGHVKVGHVKESGELTLEVRDDFANTEKSFFTAVPEAKDRDLKVKAELVKLKPVDEESK